ncbi:hypothetical protein GCM10010307_22480 [Streptomyces vastus]|uniref:Helix-turn-helix domain-containing protein n=1 Tax=Streptomyces vastus TaxID=285451 RepID=A0ABN3QN24_9ACTN
MRYAQGGGLTDERRAFREKSRVEAAERFAQGYENAVIAHDLRVSVRSVQRWRRVTRSTPPGRPAAGRPGRRPGAGRVEPSRRTIALDAHSTEELHRHAHTQRAEAAIAIREGREWHRTA